MFLVELFIVLLAIWLGARLGGIGIGFAGGMGVLILTLGFGMKPGVIPFDVIEIIMAVIAAIAAMQVAGGMDYLVSLAERLLRRHPRYVTFLAPLVTYMMTLLAGTGHTAFSTLPVIAEVAKEPRRPPFPAFINCGCRLSGRDYRLPHFRCSGVLCHAAGTARGELYHAAGDCHSGHHGWAVSCRPGDQLPG